MGSWKYLSLHAINRVEVDHQNKNMIFTFNAPPGLLVCALLLFSGLPQTGISQDAVSNPVLFPGARLSRGQREWQKRADRFFDQGRYERAYKIYHLNFAWRGDKYAQYMIGMMHWSGQGRPVDRIQGAAWLRLAAQRGNVKIMATRDTVWNQLSEQEGIQAEAQFKELRKAYGDRRVIRRLVQQDRRYIRASLNRFATMRGGKSFDADGNWIAGSADYRNYHDRIEQRIGYLKGYVELGELTLIDDDESYDQKKDSAKDDTDH